jgi:hypothetical protein
MPVISHNVNRTQLEERRQSLLDSARTTWGDLSTRRQAGLLTPEEWALWEEVDGINYLLGD